MFVLSIGTRFCHVCIRYLKNAFGLLLSILIAVVSFVQNGEKMLDQVFKKSQGQKKDEKRIQVSYPR